MFSMWRELVHSATGTQAVFPTANFSDRGKSRLQRKQFNNREIRLQI